jgi:hypothetical protein
MRQHPSNIMRWVHRWVGCTAAALLVLVASMLLVACSQRAPVAAVAAVKPNQIAWFNGSMEQALEAAQQQNKPLLVYWGAVWCPYCQALKNTVFARADFIEKSKLFVPVYLDGDLPGAQTWGQKLKVAGYPTVLMLRPDQTEISRLSGGMDLSLYALLLDDAIRDERPIQAVLAGDHNSEGCHRLSYYAWDPDALTGMDAAKLTTALTGAAASCWGTDRVRLEVLALGFALQITPAPADLKERVSSLYARLDEPDLMRGATDLLGGIDDSLFAVVMKMTPDVAVQFRDRYVARLMEAADRRDRAEADRLLALAGALDATKSLTIAHAIPASMQASAHTRVQAALEGDGDKYARGDIVNAAGIVYGVLGDDDAAYQLYTRELPNTATPYYYMSHLGAIAEKRGQQKRALDWYAEAYAVSHGPATRVRWGSSYMRALIRLTPEDVAGIRAAALGVAAEVGSTEGAQGRTRDAFAKVRTVLEQWATTPQRKAVLTEVVAHLPAGVG